MKCRNYYRQGFNMKDMVPVREEGGSVLIKAIVQSDFSQLVGTDMTNELANAKVWLVVSTSSTVKAVRPNDHVVILKAGMDQVDPSSPYYGVVDTEEIRLVVVDKKYGIGVWRTDDEEARKRERQRLERKHGITDDTDPSDEDDLDEPRSSSIDDYSDDEQALASAGFGMDESYHGETI